MSAVAVLGAGRVGEALATGLARAGHDVTIGARRPEAVPTDSGVQVTDLAAAIRSAPMVINALPGHVTLEVLTPLRDALAGRVLLDVSNATADNNPGTLLYPGSSLAAHLQDALPGTAVVKSLNTMLFLVMTNPGGLSSAATAFLSGDDVNAKTAVAELLHTLGWQPETLIDLGGINTASAPEAMMLLVPAVLKARGMHPFALGVIS